jgi:hypothetical protein
MAKVVISGWRKGCNTVAAIKQVRAGAPMPLNEAADVVNRVLRKEEVEVMLLNSTTAEELADSLNKIGLVAKSVGD